ncbi:MAG: hypothetical protein KDC44_14440 [Phaeodactylibacter sp.]|nr:hypothetical protein [Phaeodactylibacter sp.]
MNTLSMKQLYLHVFVAQANEPGFIELFFLCPLPDGYKLEGGLRMEALSSQAFYLPVQVVKGQSALTGFGCLRRRIDIRERPNWQAASIRVCLHAPDGTFFTTWVSLQDVHDRPVPDGVLIAPNRAYACLAAPEESNQVSMLSLLIPVSHTSLAELDKEVIQLLGQDEALQGRANIGILDQKTAVFLMRSLCFQAYEDLPETAFEPAYLSVVQLHFQRPGGFLIGAETELQMN